MQTETSRPQDGDEQPETAGRYSINAGNRALDGAPQPGFTPSPSASSPSPAQQASLPVDSAVPGASPVPEPIASAEAHRVNSAASDIPVPPRPISSPGARPQAPAAVSEPPKQSPPKGLVDLYDSEKIISEVDSGDDGRFVLTNQRVIYQGRASDDMLFASAAINDVKSIAFGRRPRDARGAWWGTIGLIAAVAVWQVTTNETVGAVAGAVVAAISLLLLADYWFRPAGLVLRFGTAGGIVEGAVAGKRVREAEQMAAQLQQMLSEPVRSAATTVRPPGGSPGIG